MSQPSVPHSSIFSPSDFPELRRSTRIRHTPSHLKDYHHNLPHQTSSPHAISYVLSYHNLSPSYFTYIHNMTAIKEPSSYSKAIKHSYWQDAMNVELKALQDNQTWQIIDLLPSKKAIGNQWVYKVKYNPDGTVERCKACLVAKGFT